MKPMGEGGIHPACMITNIIQLMIFNDENSWHIFLISTNETCLHNITG